MINMMKDILQYVPYALLVGMVLLMITAGVLITANYFRKEGGRTAKR
jgi:Photosystem I reaction centre subunit IX / PsaJ